MGDASLQLGKEQRFKSGDIWVHSDGVKLPCERESIVQGLNDLGEVCLPLIFQHLLGIRQASKKAQTGRVIEAKDIRNGMRRGDSVIDLWMEV